MQVNPAQRVPSVQSGQVRERKDDCLVNSLQKVLQVGMVCTALSPIGAVIKIGALEYAPVAALVSFIAIALLFEHELLPS